MCMLTIVNLISRQFLRFWSNKFFIMWMTWVLHCTYRRCFLRAVHANAVHADLNGVACRSIWGTVGEVELNGLDGVDAISKNPNEMGQKHWYKWLKEKQNVQYAFAWSYSFRMSSSWLKTSWLMISDVWDDGWDMAAKKLSVQDKRGGSLSLQG